MRAYSPDLRGELADTAHGHHHVVEGFASGPVIADRHGVEGVQAASIAYTCRS